ncbi:MAG: hypothetical protein ABSH08_21535, partial [Tepidisphaeraceae bacterium]
KYYRFLNQKFGEFRNALANFLQVISVDGQAKKIESAKNLASSLEVLRSALSAKDQPPWLQSLLTRLGEYQQIAPHRDNAGRMVLETIISVGREIENQKWDIENSNSIGTVQFAAIYEAVYVDSPIPKLFDALIAQLEWIIDSGKIDSISAIKQLEKLLANLRRNSKADIFSREYVGRFVQIFSAKLCWKYLESIPGLKQPMEALHETMTELGISFTRVGEEVMKRLAMAVEPEAPRLPQNEFPALPAPRPEESDVLPDTQS